MKSRGFRYAFSFKELKWFLFARKRCPVCSGMLRQQKRHKIRTDLYHNSGIDPVFAPGAKVKEYSYYYVCEKCYGGFSLSDLANRKGNPS